MKILQRMQAARLTQLLATFPAVLLYGPRQCGKSTLSRSLLPGWTVVDLERPSDAALLNADLEGFLAEHSRKLSIDEAQRLPGLFPALRHVIDKGRGNGRFLLTGSAGPALLANASESLAGRIGMLELTPFMPSELNHYSAMSAARGFWGGYPSVLQRRGAQARADWLDAYVSTYLERDLPMLGVQLSTVRLRALLQMLTYVHGNILNVSDLARSLTVAPNTVANDLDVLEATFMIRRLAPFFANVQKRLSKSPKVYVRDSGLLHFLAGLRQPPELKSWPRRGASFEGLAIEQLCATALQRFIRPGFFHWRTQAGAEVDLLIVAGRRTYAVEIKLGAAVDPRSLAGLRQCMADLGLKRGYVVTTGDEQREIGRGITIVPWKQIAGGGFLD
jgi:predicted AAA+ superfamily ATPase